MRNYRLLAAVVVSCIVSAALAGQDSRPEPRNPFLSKAKIHYAPDRDFDLKHLAVAVTVDYPGRAIQGTAVNTMAPLHDGVTRILLDAAPELDVTGAFVDGAAAKFTHLGGSLAIECAALPLGKDVAVKIVYGTTNAHGGTFGQQGGWHWIDGTGESGRVGFWTQGETDGNHHWVPTWDYPNDFATTETVTTVPADWEVVGNGVLVSTTTSDDKKTRTFTWKMAEPHATYLLSLCGGPFEIKRDEWRGVPLWYVVPKGKGGMIDDSFGDTPDMLSFFSDVLGVKYPWPKYAQDAMYDFGGGMENVSATTLSEGALTDRRSGFRIMSSVNSHELAHQWFGDYVTCRDWGHIWLNESFATFMQALYFEHSRGKAAYEREIEQNMQGYFQESRRYKRPLATNLYPNADAMFDRHTYPKGSVILHTLRRKLGDQRFFAGLHHYLVTHAHQPVVSNDLCEAMSETSGINCEPFWNQWIYKPGHPVLETSWSWDDAKKEAVVSVKQLQDTRDGTPVYAIDTTVGIIAGGALRREKVDLKEAAQEFRIACDAKPDAVMFDPDHDFLREMKRRDWAPAELLAIVALAPCGIDRAQALSRLLADTPSDDVVDAAVKALRADGSPFPALETPEALVSLTKKSQTLRPFFREQLDHPSFRRRAAAIQGLGKLAADPEDAAKLRALLTDEAPFDVFAEAAKALAAWKDMDAVPVLKKLSEKQLAPAHKRAVDRALKQLAE